MIINNSRHQSFDSCQRKTYNWDELRLSPKRLAEPLALGGAFHKGVAHLAVSHNIEECQEIAEKDLAERVTNLVFEEDRIALDKLIHQARSMMAAYGEHWVKEQFTILHPEVSFCVALPNSEHHCWYIHRLLHEVAKNATLGSASSNMFFTELWKTKFQSKGDPLTLTGLINWFASSDYETCEGIVGLCFIPHYLTGTTDAIILMKKMLWLMEHKTTAYDLYNTSPQSRNWIDNWYLANQASAYIYGVWKSIGIRPEGVLTNVVIKPRKNASNPVYNFYREAFLRTEEHLLDYEREITMVAQDYELAMRTGRVRKNPNSCFNYARRCEYWDSCVNFTPPDPLHFTTRSSDYVEAQYYKLLGMEPPASAPEKEEVIEEQA